MKEVNVFGTLYEEGGSSLSVRLIKLYLWNRSFRLILSFLIVYITLYDSGGKLSYV